MSLFDFVPRITTKIALVATAAIATACVKPTVEQEAMSLASRHREDDAVKLLRARLAGHPDDVGARSLLVRMAAIAGDSKGAQVEATELERRLAKSDPRDPRAWIALGNALEISHEFEEALAAYDIAASVAPESALGPHEGGMRAARWGEVEEAIPRLEEATRRDPSDLGAWHALGLTRLFMRDAEGADAAYRACLAVDRSRADCWLGLSSVAVMEDEPVVGLAAFDAIMMLRPTFASGELGRAWALWKLGRNDDARRAIDRAEELGASPQVVAKQRRRLRGE
jgi:Flp pilus assembly protein TadD